ncbi:hypothetical protein FGO68_gene148 [Halteria grandinella]|uniref:Uncharacterized protein n=1 Tax=Halteria grandinella TaxID=5974 RepID=A0A8J8NDE5_HALGN|nr:hypothetical protein FGO68_gene148 [Halteria grandinella]
MNQGGSKRLSNQQALKIHRSFDHGGNSNYIAPTQPSIHNQSQEYDQNSDNGVNPLLKQVLQRSLDSHGNPKLILYSYRWIVLLCYSLASIAVGMMAGTCTTIASLLTKVYGLSEFESNLTNFVYYIMYVPANFLAIAVLNKWGLKPAITIGTLFVLLGGWIRMFLTFTGNFTPYFMGAIVAAIGQPFLMNIPSKIASTWFGDKERAIATAVGSMAVPIGTVISFVLPQTCLSQNDADNPEIGKQHFSLYIMIQTFVVTLFCIPALTFIREEPPSPPSVVANDTNHSMGFGEGLKQLVSNRNYILLFICYNFIYGIQASMGAIYSNLASKYEYDLSSNSLSCLLFLVGGILNSFFLGILLYILEPCP